MNRLTVAVGRAFRQDCGTRGAAAKKRSFDKRTRKRFSEAGISTAAIREKRDHAAGTHEKILRHYTRGLLPFSFEYGQLPLVLTFFRLGLAGFADR
ncbi:hypothetical protein [Caballeronia temeraria]|uniref:hypothetical protein n=1 Tax=Caballeronia temeraria TaxID=1777137 RepID=UPI0012FE7A76|nr:hypothetical protein [Caballeronia temeraria]